LGQKGLARSGRSNQEDVGFLELDVGFSPGHLDALVMVVDSYSQLLFRPVLAHDVLIEESFDLRRLGEMDVLRRGFVILILVDDVLANPNAFVTNEYGGSRNQFTNVILTLVAE